MARILSFFVEQFLNSSSHHHPPQLHKFRCFSSETNCNFTGNHKSTKQRMRQSSKRPKSTTKTSTAISMARLINTNSWSSELQSSFSSLAPSLSKTTVDQTLRLIKSPQKALQFFNWVQQMGFAHNHQSFFLMLEILGRNRNLNVARNFLLSIEKRSDGVVKLEDKFFNSLIRSYGEAGLFQESIKMFTMMKSMGVSPSAVTFNILLLVLFKRGRTSMAKNVFDEMLSTFGVTPDVYTFNILIRGFCKNSMVDEGFRFFKEMERFKCVPDVVTFNTIVDGLCRAGKVKIACNVVKGMGKKNVDLKPNVVSYTTLIRGYCMKQEIDEALLVFEEMISQGLKPSGITYNTLIKGLCEVRKFEKIREVLEGAKESGGFTPDTCTFNTVMVAHCSGGNLVEAFEMFDKMRELQVLPDSSTYSALIRSLCHSSDFERAEKLFDELSEKEILLSDTGCTPLVAAYNPMFEYLCGNGKTKKAEKVFRQLMRRGTQDPSSFKTLIVGHCKEGRFKAGYELLVLMLRRDYVPDFEMYDSLINGLLQKGDPLLAQETLEKMLKSSHLPRTSTFHSILAELVKKKSAHESASLVMLMLEKKIRQSITLSTRTVILLFGSGLRDKAFQIVGLLYDNGFVIEIGEVISFLCQSRKILEAHKMLLFSLQKNHSVDIHLYSTVIEGLCKIHKLSEAFELYYELVEVEKGLHQHLSCLEDLKNALEAGGRPEEAKFVFKRMPKQLRPNKSPN
ncbi:pentatricopeptide repeat-containing protein At1g02060, chloroplastic [Pistacia vera]|uniref:pentatricopeptide repeat-containing protein At1g02060, chloroplastic n=1 Tax=Pistacia vera TaxID=55513 RepID=UPI001263977E|nr:pentatricopeptide repeat-containing protein At1g02060, chloroplastic [Pistacia vera]